MDFSGKYIEMCEKAAFIQQTWDITYGDYYCDRSAAFATRDGGAGISLVDEKILIDVMNQDFKRAKAVWLPRQDQCLELLNITAPSDVIRMLNEFTSEGRAAQAASMEQLLLLAYAHYKHEKTWKNENWL